MGGVTIEDLQREVEERCSAVATFAYSARVRHVFADTVWEGLVHVFELRDHSGRSHAYAWASSSQHLHIVREGAGIIGPAHAVRAMLMGQEGDPRF